MRTRRLKRVPITAGILIDMITEGWTAAGILSCEKGVPKDAMYVGSYTDLPTMEGGYIFSHPDFAGVDETAAIPVMHPQFRITHPSPSLPSLTDYNEGQWKRWGLGRDSNTELLNGIACPKCATELRDEGMEVMTSSPAMKRVVCLLCGFKGNRYLE